MSHLDTPIGSYFEEIKDNFKISMNLLDKGEAKKMLFLDSH